MLPGQVLLRGPEAMSYNMVSCPTAAMLWGLGTWFVIWRWFRHQILGSHHSCSSCALVQQFFLESRRTRENLRQDAHCAGSVPLTAHELAARHRRQAENALSDGISESCPDPGELLGETLCPYLHICMNARVHMQSWPGQRLSEQASKPARMHMHHASIKKYKLRAMQWA